MCGCARSPQTVSKVFRPYFDLLFRRGIDPGSITLTRPDLQQIIATVPEKKYPDSVGGVIFYFQVQIRGRGLRQMPRIQDDRHCEYETLEWKGRGSVGCWAERKG